MNVKKVTIDSFIFSLVPISRRIKYMQNFNVNSTIYFQSREYQLRTSNNGQASNIVSALFRNGEFVNSKEMKYNETNNGKLLEIIKKFHERRKSEIERFFALSQKLRDEKNYELQNMLGLIFARNNMQMEAIREFGNVINNNPSDSWAYDNLGKALLSLKKYDVALKAFQRAIELNPSYSDLYNNCGIAYLEIGECKKAIDQFDKAIELNSYYAEAYFNRALAYILNQIIRSDFELTQNYLKEVTKSLEKARLINPMYQNEYYSKGIEYLKNNDPLKAFETLKNAKFRGTLYFQRYDKYEYYLKLFATNETNQFEVIWKYIKFLQELLKKYPNHADIYNDLGLAYSMLRNYINEKAINSFKSALEINPKFEKASRNYRLSVYERTGSELFLKALTTKSHRNGRVREQNDEEMQTLTVAKNSEE